MESPRQEYWVKFPFSSPGIIPNQGSNSNLLHWQADALPVSHQSLESVVWPPDVKNWLIGKDTDAGKDWRQEEKGITEDEMVWWHQLDRHEFVQAPEVGDG